MFLGLRSYNVSLKQEKCYFRSVQKFGYDIRKHYDAHRVTNYEYYSLKLVMQPNYEINFLVK